MDQRFQTRRAAQQLFPTLTLSFLACLSVVLPLPSTEPPLIDGHPFVAIWNTPTKACKRLNIPLDTSPFHAVTTPEDVPNQFLTLFYISRLGLYPYFDQLNQREVNGGIPQRGNLRAHLIKAHNDIAYYMPSASAPGLAVIDWEEWRPLWDRNWGSKNIYRQLSINYAQQNDPSLSPPHLTPAAKSEFQAAARRYMEGTETLGARERPRQLWGFYLFPDCYNHDWENPGYTGECSDKTKRQNDELLWLWESSTALYPSIYLAHTQANSPSATMYVRNRVQEAVRVSALPQGRPTVPIYVYSRPLYKDQSFLSQEDLVSTIGETAALGASGSVLWGASADFRDQATCESLSTYLTATLNPYIANVTAAAKLCSEVLCQSSGRCVRKNYNSNDYLHLNPSHFRILKFNDKYLAAGLPSTADLNALAERFTCQCYTGQSCYPRLSYPSKPMVIYV